MAIFFRKSFEKGLLQVGLSFGLRSVLVPESQTSAIKIQKNQTQNRQKSESVLELDLVRTSRLSESVLELGIGPNIYAKSVFKSYNKFQMFK